MNHLELLLNHRDDNKPIVGFYEGRANVYASGMDKVTVTSISRHHGRIMERMREQGWTCIEVTEDDLGDEDCQKIVATSKWIKE